MVSKDDEKEERILLPEELSVSTIYMDGDNDVTLQCMDSSDVPLALRSSVHTGRDVNQWQSRCVLCIFIIVLLDYKQPY